MNLKIVHVNDLHGMYFNIPYYQRGYRWETKQVYNLLDDLLEFKDNEDKNSIKQFYCLQPLVVVENKNLRTDDNSKVYDVIDGQQRLTTLFLLMHYLKVRSIFNLRYDRACRKDSNNTDYNDGRLKYDELINKSDDEISKNPDLFYMIQAKKDIDNWFNMKFETYDGIDRYILDSIAPMNYKKQANPFFLSNNDEEDPNDDCQDVRFIWYNASKASVINYKDSIKIFRRLNYGKTSLSAADLIKALLFQCDVYDNVSKPVMKQIAFRMSTEWDAMEKYLQDEFMWSMLSYKQYDRISHIDLILSIVAKDLLQKNEIKTTAAESDSDYEYHIFDKYIQMRKTSGDNYDIIVKDLWTNIQDTFGIFRAWYKNRELYHLIGLYFTLNNSAKSEHIKLIENLLMTYKQKNKKDFIRYIKTEIGKIISIEKLKNDKEEPLKFEDLNYHNNPKHITLILLTYNVNLTMEHSQDRQYFPFNFYRSTQSSLEHIHPQHLHNDEIDFYTLCNWFKEKSSELVDKRKKNKDLNDAIEKLNGTLNLSDEVLEQKTDKDKETFKTKENDYKENESEYSECLAIVDKYFDELADISEDELHKITNMALVDKITNTILGNGLLNQKRGILQRLSDEYDRTNGKSGACTFAGTWKVFNKDFSIAETDPKKTTKSSNLKFWSKVDRENYLKDLENTYNEYVK